MSPVVLGWAGGAADLVRANAIWAGPVCFLLAFAESLAFVSVLVPTTVMLVAVGALIDSGGLSFWTVWLGASLGAVAGDWLSYLVGRHYGDGVGRLWPLTRYPDLLPRGRRFFERWGVLGIALGRFFGPLRASIPLVAGICAMPLVPFQVANVVSALAWSLALLLPGLLGARWLPGWLG